VSVQLTVLTIQFLHFYAYKFPDVGYKRDMEYVRENNDFCTIKEAARLSGLALKTWYHGGAGTDKIPRIRFGRSVRLLRKDVEHFINERISQAELPVKTVGNR
jgi:predicted DNA-binding transcriptional regulator AlpA